MLKARDERPSSLQHVNPHTVPKAPSLCRNHRHPLSILNMSPSSPLVLPTSTSVRSLMILVIPNPTQPSPAQSIPFHNFHSLPHPPPPFHPSIHGSAPGAVFTLGVRYLFDVDRLFRSSEAIVEPPPPSFSLPRLILRTEQEQFPISYGHHIRQLGDAVPKDSLCSGIVYPLQSFVAYLP